MNYKVDTLNNDAKAIVDAAGLNSWGVVKMQMGIIGKTETRPYVGRHALVNNRTGQAYDICSSQYQIHQPRELVYGACVAASEVGARVDSVDVLQGGENIVVKASWDDAGSNKAAMLAAFHAIGEGLGYEARKEARHDAGYRVGQKITSGFAIRIGNSVGNPCKVTALCVEIRCLNGLVSDAVRQVMSTTHKSAGNVAIMNLRELLPSLQSANARVIGARNRLTAIKTTDAVMRSYLLELSQPELFDAVLTNTIGARGETAPDVRRNLYLDALQSSDIVARVLLNTIEGKDSNRYTRRTVDALYSQPMADETHGTLYQPYMSATYAIDHLAHGRGEFASDNVADNSLFGAGRELKAQALELAIAYADGLQLARN